MRLTIFGSGYVGLVTGACMAETGNHVVCVDIDKARMDRLNAGKVPVHEPGSRTATEWQEFRSPDFGLIREKLAQPVIFDGRNLYDPDLVVAQGLSYFAIGRSGTVG